MSLGDKNPISGIPSARYGFVKNVSGKYSDVKIIFDADDGGFHLVYKSPHSNLEHFYGSGNNVKIFKTLAGAERTAKKL